MKYYKVHRNRFNGVRSIILTTLLGEQVSATAVAIDPTCYGNLPTTLLTIVSDLNRYLQARPTKPSILNPAGDGTTFDHRWDQSTYSNFRDRMKVCSEKMEAAAAETDPERSMKLWQDIFGPTFKPLSSTTSGSSSNVGKFDTGAGSGGLASQSGKSG